MARILIVDDEPDVVLVARITLEKAGHEVEETGDGEGALKKLKKEKFDLILLDVMLPGSIDGWEVCRRIRADKKTKNMPVVMFTVRTSEDSVARGRECGADAQIDKPFGIDDLIGTVEKALKGS